MRQGHVAPRAFASGRRACFGGLAISLLAAGCAPAQAPALDAVVPMAIQGRPALQARQVLAGGFYRPPAPAGDALSWNLSQIRKTPYRLQAGGGARVVVAVLDTGADPAQPELAGRLYPLIDMVGSDRYPSGSLNVDYTGRDGNGHGTHVAGIVTRVSAGFDVHVLPIKVIPHSGVGDDRRLSDGIERAIAWRDKADPSLRVKILNLSVSSPQYSDRLKRMIAKATEAGMLVVGASGNGGASVEFPANLSEVLAVGATGPGDGAEDYSGRGSEVDIGAPGGNDYEPVVSAWPGYLTASDHEAGVRTPHTTAGLVGTSMAAPHVAGTAAALWAAHPHLSARQVRANLLAMADDQGEAGPDVFFGFGRLNFERALDGDRHDAH